jgi:hypothetical protein
LNGRDQNNEEAALRERNEQRFIRRFGPLYWGVPLVLLTLVVFGAVRLLGGPGLNRTHQDQPKPAAQAKDSETANWKTLKNKYGWKIKYPPDWPPAPNPEAAPSVSALVEFIYRHFDCAKERCASFQIQPYMYKGVNDLPEEDAEPTKNIPNLFFRRRIRLGGLPAVDTCWYSPESNGGQLAREIIVVHKGREVKISYGEGGPDGAAIKTPADWKYVGIFDKILSTMSFYDVPDSVWPTP